MRWSSPLLRVVALCVTSGCDAAPEAAPLPTSAWPESTPEAQGVDSDALTTVIESAIAGDFALHELWVVRHGYVVARSRFFPYDGERPHDIASCTKSLTALAVGVALDRGDVSSLDAPLLPFFPRSDVADDARKQAITLRHALSMTAGFECISSPFEQTLVEMQASADWSTFTLGLPMADSPGASFRYCGPVSHLLSGVVTAASGQPADALLGEAVFAPIGIGDVSWPRDASGSSHGWGDARMHAEDLARLGLLLLREGRWGSRPVLNAEFVRAATSNRVGTLGPANGYGYQFWGAEGGAYYANGRGGQFLFVSPAADLVVVAFGSAGPEKEGEYGALLAGIVAELSEAPLPADEVAVARLAEAQRAAARPPAKRSPLAVPPTWAELGGRRFVLESNPLGWSAIGFDFDVDEARLRLEVSGAVQVLEVGLDGVARVSRGVTLDEGRLTDVDVALLATGLGEDYVVGFDTIDSIDAGTMTFRLDAGRLRATVFERTFLHGEVELTGMEGPLQ